MSMYYSMGETKSEVQLYDYAGNLLMENIKQQRNSIGLSIHQGMKIEVSDKYSVPFIDLIKKGEKLFYSFSSMDCSRCIDFELSLISLYQEEIGIENFSIIFEGMNSRTVRAYKREYNIRCECLILKQDELGLPIDSLGLPFYFIVNNKSDIVDVFIPSKDLPGYDENYLRYVVRRFKKSDSSANGGS